MVEAQVVGLQQIEPFKFRWPEGYEEFEGGWDFQLTVAGSRHRVRHGIGGREVYGRWRVHTVTWLDREVQVEGVESDDYPVSRGLLSQLRYADKKVVRELSGVPAGYERFELVEHRHEIDAKYAPYCIAVKIRDDDLPAWGVHAWLRMCQRRNWTGASSERSRAEAVAPRSVPTQALPAAPTADSRAVAAGLLAHGARTKIVQRCLLMTTDPGDLVLDPTCGAGTTALVAEQWGRRWITVDTSHVALTLARQRLMGARMPWYMLVDSIEGRKKEGELSATPLPPAAVTNDIRHGFAYERVQHITLKSIANNPDINPDMSRKEVYTAIRRYADFESLRDKPYENMQKVRVSGPFTVESLSPHRSLAFAGIRRQRGRQFGLLERRRSRRRLQR